MSRTRRYLISAIVGSSVAVGAWLVPFGTGPADAAAQGNCYDCYVIVSPLDCTDECSHGDRCPCICCVY